MDLCFYLFLLFVVLVFVTLVGHGLWVLVTPVFRRLYGDPFLRVEARGPGRRLCVRCGCPFPRSALRCPECGLDPAAPVAGQLRRLENTAREIQTLVEEGALGSEVGEQVYRVLESKQQRLIAETPATEPLLVWQLLERLLRTTPDVRQLLPAERKQALGWYRNLNETELAYLSGPALLALARLLRLAGLSSRAFEVYRLLMLHHPGTAETREGGMEASRFAARDERDDLAYWFEERARGLPLAAQERGQAEETQRSPWDRPAEARPGDATLAVPVEREPGVPSAAVAHSSTAPPPRRSFGEMMLAFMEERNILWGELVGGLLIVGCSIALVISLWSTLENIPYFPFLIFAALTGALFGAGVYTLSHWKLEATSRGLLVIATLLTPLNFLILAGLWRGQEAGLLDWVTEAAAVFGLGALVWAAGRILVGRTLSFGPWRADILLMLAIVGAAASQLLVPHLLDAADPRGSPFRLVSFVPVVFYALPIIPVLYGLSRREQVDRTPANGLFLFLGLAFFAVAVALGFLVYWQRDWLRLVLQFFALPCAVAGMPPLIAGALLHRQLDRTETTLQGEGQGLSLGLLRLLGTGVALGGMAIMVAALVLAWPRPNRLMEVGFLNAIVFTVVALRYRLPHAHVPALLCLGVGYLTCLMGNQELLLQTALDRAATLPALAVLLAISSEWLVRRGRRLDGLIHILGSAAACVIALLVVGREGFAYPVRGAVVFGVSGVGALIMNTRWRRPLVTYAGNFVILGAIAYVLRASHAGLPTARFWVIVLLTHASLSTLVYLLLTVNVGRTFLFAEATGGQESLPSEEHSTTFLGPMRLSALLASASAILPLGFTLQWHELDIAAACAFWLAALWLVISWSERWPAPFAGVQAAVTAGTLISLSAWLQHQIWVARTEDLFHLWSLQTYLLGLGVLSVFWVALRRALRSDERAQALLEPAGRTLDWAIFVVVVIGQLVIAVVAVVPDAGRELLPRELHAVFAGRHVPLDLGSAWSLLAILVVGLTATLWERRPHEAVLGLLVLALTVPLLIGEWSSDDLAAASSLRWALSLAFLGCSVLLWQRERLLLSCARWGIRWPAEAPIARVSRWLLLAGAVGPVLLVTLIVALLGFAGQTPPGPVASSVFARLGWVPNMVIPLVVVGAGLFGHGVRENTAGYIFAAGLVLVATLTGGYALGRVIGGVPIGETEAVFIVQLGIVAAGMWAVAWLSSGRWRNHGLLSIQVGLAMVPGMVLLATALVQLVADPAGIMADFVIQAGHWLGWLGLLTAASACAWLIWLVRPQRTVDALALGGILIGILAACALAGWDQGDWLAYHVLVLAGTLLGLLLLSAGWIGSGVERIGPLLWTEDRRARAADVLKQLFPVARTQAWVDILGAGVVLLALRSAWSDPGRPYWSSAATLAIAVLIGGQAVWARRPAYVYASGLLVNLVGYLVWQAWLIDRFDVRVWMLLGPGLFDHFLLIQVVCFAAASASWSLVDWVLRRRIPPVDVRASVMPFPHAAALVAVHLLAVLVLTALGSDLLGLDVYLRGGLAWAALLATGIALVICLWDAEASLWGLPAAPLFVLGLLIIGFMLHGTHSDPRRLGWLAVLSLASYLALTNGLIRLASFLSPLWHRLRVPARAEGWLEGWYQPALALIALFVVSLSVWMCLDLDTLSERLSGPLSAALVVLAGVLSVPLLTNQVSQRNTVCVRVILLGLCGAVAIELGWALLDPALLAPWLHRSVLVLAVTAVLAVTYSAGWVPGGQEWVQSGRRLGRVLGISAAAMLAVVLVQEFFWYDKVTRSTPLAAAAVAAVAAILGAVLVGSLHVAVAARNPLALTDRGRVRCVWLAELLIVLLLVHLRLSVADLFPGFLGRNWAFVMMVLGFAGVGLGELFQRRGLPMLAEPLRRTGLFLPLLPLLAFLARSLSELRGLEEAMERAIPGVDPIFRYLDRLPAGYGMHALLWFLLGLLYAGVALLRRASGYALLAALAANFGLWVIYAHQESLAFALHPQVWLVPVGLIVLAAEHLNRDRLSPAQSQATRYLGLLFIYLSSTADMFITGLGESVLLPVVLALLSVAGVLAGILLRVRAFMFLGVAFLGLVVFSQIWHAAVDRDQTWVWWASGVVLGAAIFSLFALFEKRRQDVLRMLEEIKRWH